jgi:haloacetate dehalogenase
MVVDALVFDFEGVIVDSDLLGGDRGAAAIGVKRRSSARSSPGPEARGGVDMALLEGFETLDVETSGARIHLRHGGEGPPVLLLHGNPLTHVSWAGVAERLRDRFHVVAADLRGYGDSSAPEPGERHANYSFRAMAQDQVEVMEALGFERFYVAGHDRGARTTLRMALDHPKRVASAAFVDIVPTHYMWTHVDRKVFIGAWHWSFMAQPAPFPERLMAAVPAEEYLRYKMSLGAESVAPFTGETFAEYVRCFDEKTIRGSCEDYRAAATCDFALDRADFEAGRKVEAPALVTWGTSIGRLFADIPDAWSAYASDTRCVPVESGHYVPDEAPDALAALLAEHFATAPL